MSTSRIRYAEYYDMQKNFDWLYERSLKNKTYGLDLYGMIISKENIVLAYRNIKSNTGSKTKGTDGKTINDYKYQNEEKFIEDIRKEIMDYKPSTVRRVEIPKANGKTRPLGIPTMKDRLLQQMFKQIIEPICEAKFHKQSYGFRPLRATSHAIERCQHLMNRSELHYVVDIDIKSFFDEVNHTKLMHQLYTIGVTDKRVLAIISKMLKAPIRGEGIPKCGVPQGGILSPLLSNVVLNELDWWISSQWETFETKHSYSKREKKYRALKTSKLKEMFIVRYADDFKIFCRYSKVAWKIYQSVKEYLKKHLKLEISKEKSKVTNLRRRYTEFLGFELKVRKKKKKYTSISKVSKKNKERIVKKIQELVEIIRNEATNRNINHYNEFVLGIQNYYKVATNVTIDFSEINYKVLQRMLNRLRKVSKYGIPRSPPDIYKRLYRNKYKTFIIKDISLFPLADIKYCLVGQFNPKKNIYTVDGRERIHKNLNPKVIEEILKMSKAISAEESLEYNDNRISRYSMQRGRCSVLGEFLTKEELHCHHKIPKELGGTDVFSNLVIVHKWVHRLIHATKDETIERYKNLLKMSKKQMIKLNKLRENCNLIELT